MAVSLESANKVRQKTFALAQLDVSAYRALQAFFQYWATHKGNADLQVFQFSEAECDAAGGTALLSGACTVHFIYVKKAASDTNNYFKIFDDATDDTTTTDQTYAAPLFISGESQVWQSNSGLPLATGIVVTQHTTSEGTTDGSDGGSGFIIVAA